MLRFVVRRLLLLVPILIGLSFLVFVWVQALPGGPADSLLGERTAPELVKEYEERFGLNEPIYVQLEVRQDDRASSTSASARRHTATSATRSRSGSGDVELAIAAMLFAVGVGIPLGFFAAKWHGGVFSQSSLFLSLIGVSIPVFFLAILLKYVFAVRLGWLPSVGRIDVTSEAEHPTNFYVLDAIITRDWATLKDVLGHLVLPAIALGSIPLAIITRITRASVSTFRTRTTSAPRAKRAPAPDESTAAMCCARAQSRRSSACRRDCCSLARS